MCVDENYHLEKKKETSMLIIAATFNNFAYNKKAKNTIF